MSREDEKEENAEEIEALVASDEAKGDLHSQPLLGNAEAIVAESGAEEVEN